MDRRMKPGHQVMMISFPIAILFYGGLCSAYRHGDIIRVSRKGQHHFMRTDWTDQIGRHCPRFEIASEVLLPIPKPTGYAEFDKTPYKITLQFGDEKLGTPWLSVIGRKGYVAMVDVNLKHAGPDLVGVGAKVVPMPQHYLQEHDSIKSDFLDPEKWPKKLLVRYSWEDKSELDVTGGLLVLFGSGVFLIVLLSIHILQSSKEKLSQFIKEALIQEPLPRQEAKVE